MPALDIENPGVSAVASFQALLTELLDEAAILRQPSTIDSENAANDAPLTKSDLQNLAQRVDSSLSSLITAGPGEDGNVTKDPAKNRKFAVIETACRDMFGTFVASTSIDSPDFARLWNLFDIICILSDDGRCDAALVIWLIEELLDSQTIAGCRIIFDYLESRRERITGVNFQPKQLAMLRSCNGLLKRLSRANDTAFCGRVFIFLFQSFPLGDRSSVNLRGEYHVENVTTYENTTPSTSDDGVKMEVDSQSTAQTIGGNTPVITTAKGSANKTLSPDELYPLFWRLQDYFSQPLKLFDPSNMAKFRQSIEETTKKFFTYVRDRTSRATSTADGVESGLKRKRGEQGDHVETFNPKYLTSKDLFELEISDLTFRRHILAQTLIILEFIQSWTSPAKAKYQTMNVSNKAVIYNDEFSEEDAQWAKDMKNKIAEHIRQDQSGKFFHRIVDTIVTRDKNWVYWKMYGCNPIQKDPLKPEVYAEAQAAAVRSTTNKRLRPVPMGAVPLDFLREDEEEAAITELQQPDRYEIPELDGFKDKIADDDFEIGAPTNDQTKVAAVAGKASKSWRALRIAGRYKLGAFDKIDDPQKIDVVFKDLKELEEQEAEGEAPSEEDMPANKNPIIVSGPPGAGKTALVAKLMDERKGVFVRVVRHTTRDPAEGEVNGKDFHFVKAAEFNQLRDGDRLVEHGTRDGVDYGTSTKTVDAIVENGKVPIIELDLEAAQFAKDMDFTARYVLVKAPSDEVLQQRLKDSGKDEAAIKAIVDKLPEQLDESKVSELFDTTVVSDGLDDASKALSDYLFEKVGDGAEEEKNNGEEASGDAEDGKIKEEPVAVREESVTAKEEPAADVDMANAS